MGNEFEKAVKRLIEGLPENIKRDLVAFWSNVLESNLFYGLPLEFHQMCYELGQYRIAQDQIATINMTAKEMDNYENHQDKLEYIKDNVFYQFIPNSSAWKVIIKKKRNHTKVHIICI